MADDATAALAAALVAAESAAYQERRMTPYHERVIVALAADGWRITSAPDENIGEPPDPAIWAGLPATRWADDPVSAQAAPATEAGRRLFTDIDPMDMMESNGVTPEDIIAIEQAAVRAALEGLRDEVERVTVPASKDIKPFVEGGSRLTRDFVIALIDARLADLP